MVSCRPSEMATEATPKAVTKPEGSMPKTGCRMESTASDQMSARRMLRKIDALGTSLAFRTRRARRSAKCCTTRATTTAAATVSPLARSALS